MNRHYEKLMKKSFEIAKKISQFQPIKIKPKNLKKIIVILYYEYKLQNKQLKKLLQEV